MIRERARIVLKLGFQPDESDTERAKLIEEFVKVLRGRPAWAVSRGFDEWVRTRPRRPTPYEIGILASQAVEPFTREIAERKRAEDEQREAEEQARRKRMTPEAAKEILASADWTPKRFEAIKRAPRDVTSFADAEAAEDMPRKPHWSETVSPDGPEMQELARIRDANPMIQAARAAAERTRKKSEEEAQSPPAEH